MSRARPAVAADEPELDALFAARFGSRPVPGTWSWKYDQLPGRSRRFVAEDASGRVVAHIGALALPARTREGDRPSWQLVDVMGTTRGAGLRPPLLVAGRALLADLPGEGDAPWIFGFPSERHFALGTRTFGYLPLLSIQPWGGALPAGDASTALAISDRCAPEVEAIWAACDVCSVRRSAAFLNWRYCARPGVYYRVYRLAVAGREGLAIFGFGGDEARAAELWLPPGPRWRPALLAIAADLGALGLRRWRFWPRPGEEELLRELGASPAGEPVFVGCRGRQGGRDPVAVGRDFTYVMGDYDAT